MVYPTEVVLIADVRFVNVVAVTQHELLEKTTPRRHSMLRTPPVTNKQNYSVTYQDYTIDRLHMTSLTAIFDDKQWKRARVYALRPTRLSANDNLSHVPVSSTMAADARSL